MNAPFSDEEILVWNLNYYFLAPHLLVSLLFGKTLINKVTSSQNGHVLVNIGCLNCREPILWCNKRLIDAEEGGGMALIYKLVYFFLIRNYFLIGSYLQINKANFSCSLSLFPL